MVRMVKPRTLRLCAASIALLIVSFTACAEGGGVVASPCDINVPYDKVMTAEGEGVILKADYRYSGHDYAYHETRRRISDNALVYQAEWVTVNRVTHRRETQQGDPTTYGRWRVIFEDATPPSALPCADPDNLPEDSTESHYWVEQHPDTEGRTSIRRDYWFNPETGYPARMRRTHFYRETGEVTGHVDTVYSGFGEPNTVTGPR